jgi:hypothetical protein
MQSLDFKQRMEHVLAARVEAVKARDAKPRRLRQVLAVVAGTLICFFVLKGAAVAHNGRAFAEPLAAEAGIGAQIYQWFAGADPISATLAAALRNGPRPQAPQVETL